MKNVLKVLTVVIVVSCLFSFDRTNRSKEFFVIFGSGFRNDTVTLKINDTVIIEKIVMNSDSVTDLSYAASIHLKDGNLVLLDKNLKVVKQMPFQYVDKLRMIIRINERPYDLRADLKNGKYIVISKHWYYYNVYLNQYKKPVTFE